MHITGKGKKNVLTEPDYQLSENISQQLRQALNKLKAYVPIQHILGTVTFCGLEFMVSKDALIPRPETEELTNQIINSIPENTGVQILDIGTGTGCIPISIKYHRSQTNITAVDSSPEALTLAKKNAELNNADVNFLEMDFLDEVRWKVMGLYDVLISNPPYIPLSDLENMDRNVSEHEPHLALFVPDENPIIFYEKIEIFSQKHLRLNGMIWLEIYADLSKETLGIFSSEKYRAEIIEDMFGKKRFLKIIRFR